MICDTIKEKFEVTVMGLGSFLLRKTIKSATKTMFRPVVGSKKARQISNSAGDLIGLAGLAVGASAVIHEINKEKNSASSANTASQPSYNATLYNAALARIALGYYIARADNQISANEQLSLDEITSDVMSNNQFPAEFRNEVNAIASENTNSFINVEKYLNKVDPNTLVSFLDEAKRVAASDNAVSIEEQKALNVFEKYLSSKTGRVFTQDTKTIDMTCKNCAAIMHAEPSSSQIICPFCGSTQLIDL